MDTGRVTQLERELAAARVDQHVQHTNQLIAQLAAIRDELRSARARYGELSKRIKAEREFTEKTQGLINQMLVAIDESWRRRPACADYLPNDSEVVAWRKQHRALERQRDQVIVRRDSAPRTNVIDAVLYEGPNGIIARLEYAEQNILTELTGLGVGKLAPGGVFAVS